MLQLDSPYYIRPYCNRSCWEVFESSCNKFENMDFSELLGTDILFSKDGWLLISQNNNLVPGLFLFNPLTKQKLQLPPTDTRFSSACFTAPPTSSHCSVFVIFRNSEMKPNKTQFGLIKFGDLEWKFGCFDNLTYMFWPSNHPPIFLHGIYYCLDGTRRHIMTFATTENGEFELSHFPNCHEKLAPTNHELFELSLLRYFYYEKDIEDYEKYEDDEEDDDNAEEECYMIELEEEGETWDVFVRKVTDEDNYYAKDDYEKEDDEFELSYSEEEYEEEEEEEFSEEEYEDDDDDEFEWSEYEKDEEEEEEEEMVVVKESYMMEVDGEEIWGFFVIRKGRMGEVVRVAKLDLSDMLWKNLECLGNKCLYVSPNGSFAVANTHLANKIFLHKFYRNTGVVYSLNSGMYHSLDGNMQSYIDSGWGSSTLGVWVNPSAS